jgi:adenine phosphoribosyltransferase
MSGREASGGAMSGAEASGPHVSDSETADVVRALLDSYPDFPTGGVLFRDLTPVFASGAAFRAVVEDLLEPFLGRFDVVAGVEARGFLLAAAAAFATGTGVLAVRKAGKLPGTVLTEHYGLEYAQDSLQLAPGRLPAGTRVLLLDDVLATGGSLTAASRLLDGAGYSLAGIGVVLELGDLPGRSVLDALGVPVHATLTL